MQTFLPCIACSHANAINQAAHTSQGTSFLLQVLAARPQGAVTAAGYTAPRPAAPAPAPYGPPPVRPSVAPAPHYAAPHPSQQPIARPQPAQPPAYASARGPAPPAHAAPQPAHAAPGARAPLQHPMANGYHAPARPGVPTHAPAPAGTHRPGAHPGVQARPMSAAHQVQVESALSMRKLRLEGEGVMPVQSKSVAAGWLCVCASKTRLRVVQGACASSRISRVRPIRVGTYLAVVRGCVVHSLMHSMRPVSVPQAEPKIHLGMHGCDMQL